MPNKYIRKAVAVRGNWSEECLQSAMTAVKNENMTVYKAAILYGIPRKTLERRLKKNNNKKGPMGPSSIFGSENEKKIVSHIKAMQASGFPLTIDDLRRIAFQFAEQLNITHRFNKATEKAGYDWVQLFMSRNPDVTLRKSEGVSFARSGAMNKPEVDAYFKLLEKVLSDNELLDRPGSVFNMDETGMQLNNRPGHVLAAKGTKAVSMATSTEKGETITVIVCCNAEGTFLPPACIMKGKNKKPEFEDGFPPGSRVFMSPKSAYITSAIFLEWMKVHFVSRKPAGKVLLLLDGHATHCNSVEMLDYANENDIVLLSMPSHTSHYLQPLDRSVFKSLKIFFYEACRLWIRQHPGRRITRLQFGALLNQAWGKAASVENAISGFRATGVVPLNQGAIPNYAFCDNTSASIQHRSTPTMANPDNTSYSNVFATNTASTSFLNQTAVPSTSEAPQAISNTDVMTPSKLLKQISPLPQKLAETRKRAKQVGTLLTSKEHIDMRKTKEEVKAAKEQRSQMRNQNKILIKQEKKVDDNTNVSKRKAVRTISDSSCDSEEEPMLYKSSDTDGDEKEEDNCRGCGENYYKTLLVEDWLQCQVCKLWVHENCTEFEDMCSVCGQKKENLKREVKIKGKSKGIGKGKGKGGK